MVLRKTVRLFGWMITVPSLLYLSYNLYNLVMRGSFGALFAYPTVMLTVTVSLVFLGLILSTQSQVLGGLFCFLSPLLYLIIASIIAKQIVLPTLILILFIGTCFLLFTAENQH